MKMVKSLLLGTAAGLVAMTGAQAADLPVKAKPVQYVKICSLYGAGFYYIPGTDTCLKVGGFVRAEMNFNAGGSFNPYRVQNFDTPARDFQTIRTRAAFTLDARSQTEYGTLRSYAIIAAMNTNGGAAGGTPYQTPFSNFAFIQFAGFTAGSTASFFEFDGQGYSNMTPFWSSAQAGSGIGVFGYTAQLGNGLSATISAEDPTSRRSVVLNSVGSATYGGRRWPDVVGNLRVDQAWGSAQIMGAIHDVYGVNTLATNTTASATGYAFGGGLKINLPMLGKGDNVVVQGTYAKGATNYLTGSSLAVGIGAFALSSGFVPTANTALGPVADAVFTGAAGTNTMDLSTGYHFTGGFEHYWVSNLRTSLYGSYGRLRYSDNASAALATLAGAGTAGSANWSMYQIGSRTVWTPVTNLDLSVDVVYTKLQTAFAGSTGGGAPAYGVYQDKGFWAGMFRAQRNFYP
jgi:hypothetical protein